MLQPPSAGWQSMLQPLRLSPMLAAGRCSAGWRFAQQPACGCSASPCAARPGAAAAGWAPSRLVCTCAAAARLADAPAAVAPPSPPRAQPAGHSQPACDYTLLAACVAQLQQERWVPAKVDQAVLGSATTLYLRLRAEAAAPARTPPATAPAHAPAPATPTQAGGKSGKVKKRAHLHSAPPAHAPAPDAAPAEPAPGPAAGQAPEVASGWLALSWHTWAARLCIGSPPSRGNAAEAFAFGAQARPGRWLAACS